ncbi:placenta-expressed transcript 1 protein-like [Tiliqua scincoides]|uniref:placenta-expressed transcript 1 protein-like n=1 Tax=Tiliqua scincoides TaxID=71010 RepID=UPI00346277F8
MASLKCTLQLLFLGALLAPAYLQQETCLVVKNTLKLGSYALDVYPEFYKPDAIYTVSVTGVKNGTAILLQALPSESNSTGLWEGKNERIICSLSEDVVQKNLSGNDFQIRWTAPSDPHVQSAEIRAFVTFTNGTTLRQTQTLSRELLIAVVTPAPTHSEKPHRPTPHDDHANEAHVLHNATVIHHSFASHQSPYQSPKGSAWTSQASSFILAATQFLSIFLGFKLLA